MHIHYVFYIVYSRRQRLAAHKLLLLVFVTLQVQIIDKIALKTTCSSSRQLFICVVVQYELDH